MLQYGREGYVHILDATANFMSNVEQTKKIIKNIEKQKQVALITEILDKL